MGKEEKGFVVNVFDRKIILDDFFTVEEAYLQHSRFDGSMTGRLRRLRLIRGDAAACLPYQAEKRKFFLVEQFRWPPYSVGDEGWLLEIPAGLVSPGEDPEQCIRRELEEETGITAFNLEKVLTFYSTPGGSTERIYLFFAEVKQETVDGKIAGAPEENEDIRLRELSFEQAYRMAFNGEIRDGKTLLALFLFKEKFLAETKPNEGRKQGKDCSGRFPSGT